MLMDAYRCSQHGSVVSQSPARGIPAWRRRPASGIPASRRRWSATVAVVVALLLGLAAASRTATEASIRVSETRVLVELNASSVANNAGDASNSSVAGRARRRRRRHDDDDDGPRVLPQEQLNVALAERKYTEPRNICDELLHIPKVALMFLTPGKMPHERLWREWISQVIGLVPLDAVRRYGGNHGLLGLPSTEQLRKVAEACGGLATDDRAPLLNRQFLFTLYVHTHPDFAGYRSASLFHRSIIKHRMVAKRAQHSLTDAERLLLAEALRDPLNQRFLLLSETTLPMYGAAMIYSQTLAETVSRMNGCTYNPTGFGNLDRWNENMITPNFKKHHWRKTSQWFSCTRKHAEIIVNDTEVNDVFEKYCFPHLHPVANKRVSCSSNEHYPAIVLAVHGLDHETSCNGGGHTHVDWSKMTVDGRPRSFRRAEVRDRLLVQARAKQCTLQDTEDAVRMAARQFINATQLPFKAWLPSLPSPPQYPALNVNCSLFIRKFPAATTRAAMQVFRKFIKTYN